MRAGGFAGAGFVKPVSQAKRARAFITEQNKEVSGMGNKPGVPARHRHLVTMLLLALLMLLTVAAIV